jgi:hypothetical protein
MTARSPMTTSIGDFIVATFDGAQKFSDDPREVSRLATWAVQHLLRRARRGLPLELRGLRTR